MIIRLIFIFVVFVIIQGCSAFNGTRYESLLGNQTDLISLAYRITDDLDKRAYPPLIARHPDKPILTTTFVDNNELEKTSRFSRVLQEHMTSRFVQQGYTVREIKLRKKLFIQPKSGESMLSRKLNLIDTSQKAQAIMVGTYSYTNRAVYLSARLVDPTTSNIISAADYKLKLDRNVISILEEKKGEENHLEMVTAPPEPFLNRFLH